MNEVVIAANSNKFLQTNTENSRHQISTKQINLMPSIGEVDIFRSLQLLPGVSGTSESTSGLHIRGGTPEQNLVLLDEAPVYNSSHLLGFLSVFNPDAVKDLKLYKGGIPSRYGGRISSILDIRMKDGNKKNTVLSGGIGTIFSRLTLESPIIKDKSSFILALRRSYADILAKPFLKNSLSDL